MTTKEKAIEILKDEYDKEMACAKASYKMFRGTFNPIRRISLWRSCTMFKDHCIGINLAIRRLEKEEF